MKRAEAMKIIGQAPGYVVCFERRVDGGFLADHFPDKGAGESLIASEAEAWVLAERFAQQSIGRYMNIYVADRNLRPVFGYRDRMLNKGY